MFYIPPNTQSTKQTNDLCLNGIQTKHSLCKWSTTRISMLFTVAMYESNCSASSGYMMCFVVSSLHWLIFRKCCRFLSQFKDRNRKSSVLSLWRVSDCVCVCVHAQTRAQIHNVKCGMHDSPFALPPHHHHHSWRPRPSQRLWIHKMCT